MPDPKQQHREPLVLDVTDQTIVAEPVTPKPFLVTPQWSA
jgi:hypothetical protein